MMFPFLSVCQCTAKCITPFLVQLVPAPLLACSGLLWHGWHQSWANQQQVWSSKNVNLGFHCQIPCQLLLKYDFSGVHSEAGCLGKMCGMTPETCFPSLHHRKWEQDQLAQNKTSFVQKLELVWIFVHLLLCAVCSQVSWARARQWVLTNNLKTLWFIKSYKALVFQKTGQLGCWRMDVEEGKFTPSLCLERHLISLCSCYNLLSFFFIGVLWGGRGSFRQWD